jgi:transcriptional regulator GlxA family with amidase domain
MAEAFPQSRFWGFDYHEKSIESARSDARNAAIGNSVSFEVASAMSHHGDAAIHKAQSWLARHFSVANPIEQAARISGIPARSFKGRFKSATGHAPIDYVQRLRVEEAKRRLERTDAPVDEISWQVGYEDPAFFRRLFKRITGVTAGTCRRKFQIPEVEIVSSD